MKIPKPTDADKDWFLSLVPDDPDVGGGTSQDGDGGVGSNDNSSTDDDTVDGGTNDNGDDPGPATPNLDSDGAVNGSGGGRRGNACGIGVLGAGACVLAVLSLMRSRRTFLHSG